MTRIRLARSSSLWPREVIHRSSDSGCMGKMVRGSPARNRVGLRDAATYRSFGSYDTDPIPPERRCRRHRRWARRNGAAATVGVRSESVLIGACDPHQGRRVVPSRLRRVDPVEAVRLAIRCAEPKDEAFIKRRLGLVQPQDCRGGFVDGMSSRLALARLVDTVSLDRSIGTGVIDAYDADRDRLRIAAPDSSA